MQSTFASSSPDLRAVVAMFPNIPRHYFDEIVRSRLELKTSRGSPSTTLPLAAAGRRDAPVPKNMIELLRGFDVYIYIVVSFTPATVKWELHRATTVYRLRSMAMINFKIFASIRLYHEEFLARVIRLGQDNPSVWTMPFQRRSGD